MYKIKPQFEIPENIELPDCMYRQSPVNPTIKVSRSRPPSGTGSTTSSSGAVNGILEPIKMNNSIKPEPQPKSKSPVGKGKNKQSPSATQSQSNPNVNTNASVSTSKTQLVSQDEVKAIEERQFALIHKIASLHQTISTIHEEECLALTAKSSSKIVLAPVASDSESDSNLQLDDFVDIVINADPSKPPYSILFFYKLLQQVYGTGSIVIRAMTHSSASNVLQSKSKTAGYKYLNIFNNNVAGIDSTKKRIILTVIWKKLDVNQGAELILSPSTQTMIHGEENIARFLSRILPRAKFPKLNYDGLEWDTLVRVDSFLYHTHFQSLESLESHLLVLNGGGAGGKNKIGTVSEFLAGGKEPTIADFFMYSHTAHALLAQASTGNEAQMLAPLSKYTNIMKWMWTCQQYSGLSVFEI